MIRVHGPNPGPGETPVPHIFSIFPARTCPIQPSGCVIARKNNLKLQERRFSRKRDDNQCIRGMYLEMFRCVEALYLLPHCGEWSCPGY